MKCAPTSCFSSSSSLLLWNVPLWDFLLSFSSHRSLILLFLLSFSCIWSALTTAIPLFFLILSHFISLFSYPLPFYYCKSYPLTNLTCWLIRMKFVVSMRYLHQVKDRAYILKSTIASRNQCHHFLKSCNTWMYTYWSLIKHTFP